MNLCRMYIYIKLKHSVKKQENIKKIIIFRKKTF